MNSVENRKHIVGPILGAILTVVGMVLLLFAVFGVIVTITEIVQQKQPLAETILKFIIGSVIYGGAGSVLVFLGTAKKQSTR